MIDSDSSVIMHVRGRPVKAVLEQGSFPFIDLYQVVPGYFPVSPTGYRCCMEIGTFEECTPAFLEALAADVDRRRTKSVNHYRGRRGTRLNTPEERQAFIICNNLDGHSGYPGCILTAPEDQREMMIRLALEVVNPAKRIDDFTCDVGHWDVDTLNKRLDEVRRLPLIYEQALRAICDTTQGDLFAPSGSLDPLIKLAGYSFTELYGLEQDRGPIMDVQNNLETFR